MRRRAVIGALMGTSMAMSTSRAGAQSEWQTVVGRDLRFRLEMPAPAQESKAAEQEKGHASERIAWHSTRDGDMYDFDYVDYSPGWFASQDGEVAARDLGRGEAEKAFPTAKYKYVKDEPVQLQGWDGYALDIEAPGGALIQMRTYIAKDRLYRLLATAKPTDEARAVAARFLGSLRLAQTRS